MVKKALEKIYLYFCYVFLYMPIIFMMFFSLINQDITSLLLALV